MKFLIDADSPYSLVKIFEDHGHDAIHVRDVLGSASDGEILLYANRKRRVIVTKDMGFAYDFLKKKGLGLILIRLPYHFTADRIGNVFNKFLKEVDNRELTRSITVLELGRYRIRKL